MDVRTSMCGCTYLRVYVCTYIHTYKHTHTHFHRYTQTHTQTYVPPLLLEQHPALLRVPVTRPMLSFGGLGRVRKGCKIVYSLCVLVCVCVETCRHNYFKQGNSQAHTSEYDYNQIHVQTHTHTLTHSLTYIHTPIHSHTLLPTHSIHTRTSDHRIRCLRSQIPCNIPARRTFRQARTPSDVLT
jgi:hypothetical protein